jgi:hypothetical protein
LLRSKLSLDVGFVGSTFAAPKFAFSSFFDLARKWKTEVKTDGFCSERMNSFLDSYVVLARHHQFSGTFAATE